MCSLDYGWRQYDAAIGRFTTQDRFAEKYYSLSPYSYAANNPVRYIDVNGDSLMVTNNDGNYLFMLDDGSETMSTMTAGNLYKQGTQWFAPDADNYMPLIGVADNLSESESLKHFTSEDILAFSERDRRMVDYRAGGTGDWKTSKWGADGYFLVTVDGRPYWSDAVGQVPFAINKFRDELLKTGDYSLSRERTIVAGQKYGNGNPLFPTADNSNSYDNAMIQRAVNWGTGAYYRGYMYGKTVIGKNSNYSPKSLFK